MLTLFVVDLDGTILDNRKRLVKAGPSPSRDDLPALSKWLDVLMDESMMKDDPQVSGMRDMVNALTFGTLHSSQSTNVIYLTARNENLRDITTSWLLMNDFPILPLYMRGRDDVRRDADIKRDMIRSFGNRSIVVIDDDPSGDLAKVCTEEGWTLLKAVTCLS